jgi:hypothetical protein
VILVIDLIIKDYTQFWIRPLTVNINLIWRGGTHNKAITLIM